MRVLVVNAGSSSLKLSLLDDDRRIASAELPADAAGFDSAALVATLNGWDRPDVGGHRTVHGGRDYVGPVRIDPLVTARLRALTDLAPLHQPKSLAGLDAVSAALPGVPAVACFDTAFHATIPPAAATYALPAQWRRKYGIRRFGFHGLSHAYASRRAGELTGRPTAGLRIITCHLGAGASLCAVVDGRSVDTTMGFTPLDGLVMATRSGSVDPGLLLWLEEHEHLAPHDIATALETGSGLLALAGTSDMRAVEARAEEGSSDAQLALAVYLHRLVGSIAAMAAACGGVDVLVFTGGVGEHSALIRQRCADGLTWLGIEIDADRNAVGDSDRTISPGGATVSVLVIVAREDLQISRECREVLEPS